MAYSGIDSTLQKLGHTMYDPATINTKLSVQSGVNSGNAASRRAFHDFVVNVQQFRVYLAMLGGQSHVTMIHTPWCVLFHCILHLRIPRESLGIYRGP